VIAISAATSIGQKNSRRLSWGWRLSLSITLLVAGLVIAPQQISTRLWQREDVWGVDQALVRETLRADIFGIALPVLTLFSPNDRIVDPAATEAVMERWQGPREVVEVPASGDPASHVLAGDIVSPQTTDDLAARIVSWAEALPPTD